MAIPRRVASRVGRVTLERARPTLVDAAVLGALVVTGIVPAPLLILGLAVPFALVSTFAALNAAFSSTLPTDDAPVQKAQGLFLGMVAYATVAASLGLAITGTWHWTSWYGLGFTVIYAFVRLWRNSVKHGSLFPLGYASVWWEAAALGAGLATLMFVDVWPDVLPALPLLAVRVLGELVATSRHLVPDEV